MDERCMLTLNSQVYTQKKHEEILLNSPEGNKSHKLNFLLSLAPPRMSLLWRAKCSNTEFLKAK